MLLATFIYFLEILVINTLSQFLSGWNFENFQQSLLNDTILVNRSSWPHSVWWGVPGTSKGAPPSHGPSAAHSQRMPWPASDSTSGHHSCGCHPYIIKVQISKNENSIYSFYKIFLVHIRKDISSSSICNNFFRAKQTIPTWQEVQENSSVPLSLDYPVAFHWGHESPQWPADLPLDDLVWPWPDDLQVQIW